MSTSTLESPSQFAAILTITLDAKELMSIVRQAQSDLSMRINIPGFRRGKAPIGALKLALGPERLQEEIKERIVNRSYPDAVRANHLDPISILKVDTPDVKLDEPYVYTVEIEVSPKIELPDPAKLGLKIPEVQIDDAEVDKAIEAIQREQATAETVDRPVQAGDWVSFSITSVPEGFQDKLDPIKEQRYVVKLDQRPEGDPFVQHFPSNKAGDFVTLSTSISASFPVEVLAGAEGDFTFEIHEVREPSIPAVDDELAAKLRVESVDKLRDTIRGIILRDKNREIDRQFSEDIMAAMVEKTKVELSDDMVRREVEAVKANIMARGTLEQAAERESLSVDEFEKKLEADIREDLQKQLILRQIAVDQKIEVTEQEMMLAAQSLAMNANLDKNQFRKMLQNPNTIEEIRSRLVVEKTLKYLRDTARGLSTPATEEQDG